MSSRLLSADSDGKGRISLTSGRTTNVYGVLGPESAGLCLVLDGRLLDVASGSSPSGTPHLRSGPKSTAMCHAMPYDLVPVHQWHLASMPYAKPTIFIAGKARTIFS